jgi:hypothetical protein
VAGDFSVGYEEYDPRDLAESVALALRFFEGRKRNHDADAFRAAIAAERVIRHLEGAGFVVMIKPPVGWHPEMQSCAPHLGVFACPLLSPAKARYPPPRWGRGLC